MRRPVLLAGCLVLALPAGGGTRATATAGHASRPGVVVSAMGEEVREWKEGQRYPSGDGRFAAVVVQYWSPITVAHVVPAGSNRGIVRVQSVTGFLWLPDAPHTLLVSTSFVYGRGHLLRWDGAGSWRHVVRGHRPERDHFALINYRPASREVTFVQRRFKREGGLEWERRRTIRLAKAPTPGSRRR
jgi:hypothetical protein